MSQGTADVPQAEAGDARRGGAGTDRWRTVHRFLRHPLGLVGLTVLAGLCLVAVFAPSIAPFPEGYGDVSSASQPPSADYLFGTDHLGLGIFAQVVWGTRVTMMVGGAATLIALTIGVPMGLFSGYFGRWVDDAVSTVIDIFLTLPILPLMILVAAALGSSLTNIALVVGMFGWPQIARVVRAEAMSAARETYVEAVRAAGGSDSRILWRHILPNCIPAIMVHLVLTLASAVLAEAGLSFLGLGDPASWSWGRIIHDAHSSGSFVSSWWHTLFPSAAILLLVVSTNFVGMAINDVTNPRLQQ